MQFELSKDKKSLLVNIPIDEGRPSSSGKTMIVASTGGFVGTGVSDAKGRPISISINATVRNENR